jgi:hypothetical protein
MRPKANPAVMAMLMASDAPGYIDRLLDEFEAYRNSRARDAAAWAKESHIADDPTTDAALRAVHVDSLLQHRPADMKAVLTKLVAAEDRQAAVLLLHGHERGFWQASAGGLDEARALCAPKLRKSKKTVKTAKHSANARRLSKQEHAEFLEESRVRSGLLRLGDQMRRVLSDEGTDGRKLNAVLFYLDSLKAAGFGAIVDEAWADAGKTVRK